MKKVTLKKAIKETQGQRKFKQYLEDLTRNKHFVARIEKMEEARRSRRAELEKKDRELITDLFEKYYAVNAALKKAAATGKASNDKIFEELSEKYALDSNFIIALATGWLKEDDPTWLMTDSCYINDEYDERFNDVFPKIPFQFDFSKRADIRAFPISINVHRFASKRDVLDFIEKRWEVIDSYLGTYRDKTKRFRKRKLDRKITDFIWEKRTFPVNEIKRQLDERFPHNGLAYYEIGKIISMEKQRRLGKLV